MHELLAKIRRGLTFPPSGWALAAMLAFYVLAGLFGRDPWKGEDAIHIATTWNILAHNDWLSPDLAGREFDEPPLYYWSAALTGKLLGWLIPLHDAIRFASGIWVALALVALYYAGRELYGKDHAAASPLLLAGSAGLVINAHEAQPLLVALAAYCGTLAAVVAFRRRPKLAGAFYGLSLAGCLLGTGVAPTLPLIAAGPLSIWLSKAEHQPWRSCLIGWLVFVLLALPWPLLLGALEPARLSGWLIAERRQLSSGASLFPALGGYLGLLPFVAFPTVFIAGWTLWTHRNDLRKDKILLPLGLLALTLLLLLFAYRPKELSALLLLPPIALLATPGALILRRGAAKAFEWFSMMNFSFFAILVWVGWSALTFGWPEKLAKRALILRPGFVGSFDLLSVAAALAVSVLWIWLMATSRRSPYRSLVQWAMGFTTFWLLAALLWLPWFDYGRSYRPVAEAIARELPADHGCIAERNLGDTQRASLAYFVGVEPKPAQAIPDCRWLLIQDAPGARITVERGWSKIWEGSRPGDHKERFRLYRR